MTYPDADETIAASEARIDLAEAIYARLQPLAGTPAETYVVKTRRLPAETVRACADLKYIPSPIPGRPPQDHALVSLLRDADDEICGLQLEFCDITGAKTGTEPTKQSYALRANGVRDGLFHAGGSGGIAFLAEGYSCKALAIASLGIGRAYGAGGLHMIGLATLPERKVVLVPDREPAPDQWTKDGKNRLIDLHRAAYARAVDRLILAKREVSIAATPDCPHATCKDADDFLRQHGEILLKDLLSRTVPGELSRAGEIKRLATISDRLDREAETKTAATTKACLKGIPIKAIREQVTAERERARTEPKPEADACWETPIDDLAAVLDQLADEIGKYIATANRDTAALWSAMSHVFERLQCMPKLAIQSPTKQCGKTTFLDCLSTVVRRPELGSGVTEASFVRLSDAYQPTWCLDECDRYLNDDSLHQGLTAAINASSYRRLARKKICVPADGGKGWEIVDFEFWCPMILSGIRTLIDTVQDRSIVLVMQRARPGELKHRLVNGTSPVLEEIQRKLVRWAKDLIELDLDPEVPAFLHNREADLWRPLFAIAALAGKDWPERVLAAAKMIHGQRVEDEVRLALLLEAIREEFGTSEQMFVADLVARLIAREGEPWATVKRNGAPIDAYYLRGLLKGVVDRNSNQRERTAGGGRGRHFYRRTDFEAAWDRYIPRKPEDDPGHPGHAGQEAFHHEKSTAYSGPDQNEHPGPSGPRNAKACLACGAAMPDASNRRKFCSAQCRLRHYRSRNGNAGGPDSGPDKATASGPGQAADIAAENGACNGNGPDGPPGPDEKGPDASIYPDPSATCGYCKHKLNGAAGVMLAGQVFHADACLAEHLKRQGRA